MIEKGIGLAPRMGPNRKPGMRQRRLGRSRLYLAKDMDCGDAHVDTALGNDVPKRKRKPAPAYGAQVAKAWSDAAREASAESRRGHAKGNPPGYWRERFIGPPLLGPRRTVTTGRVMGAGERVGRFAGGVSGAHLGAGVGLAASAAAHVGINRARREAERRSQTHYAPGTEADVRRMTRAQTLHDRAGTPGEKQAAGEAVNRIKEKLKGRMTPGSPVAGRIAQVLRRAPLVRGVAAGVGAATYVGSTAAGFFSGGYVGRKIDESVKKYADSEQRDSNGRWTSGIGEHLGGVAGIAAGVYNAPRVARTVGRQLKQNRTVRGFKVPGIQRKLGRFGAAGLAAYGAVRVAGVAGGYVGRKIDEAVDRVGKGGSDE